MPDRQVFAEDNVILAGSADAFDFEKLVLPAGKLGQMRVVLRMMGRELEFNKVLVYKTGVETVYKEGIVDGNGEVTFSDIEPGKYRVKRLGLGSEGSISDVILTVQK